MIFMKCDRIDDCMQEKLRAAFSSGKTQVVKQFSSKKILRHGTFFAKNRRQMERS